MKKILFLLGWVAFYSAAAQWSPVNFTESMSIQDIHFINEQTGFAAGYHEVYKTDDGGQSWNEIASDIYVNGPTGVWFFDDNTGIIIGQDGGGNPQVSKTINGGASWTTTTLASEPMTSTKKIFFYDDNTGFIVCRNGYMFKTTDQGANWQQMTSGTTSDLSSVYFPTSSIGYASISYSTELLKTINGGNSWTKLDLGQLIGVRDLFFTDENTGYLACSKSRILKTSDGGSTWDVFDFGTNDDFYAITFTKINVGYVAGASGTLATTSNAGETWKPNTSGINNLLYNIDFPSYEVGYISSLHTPPVILKTTNGGGILSAGEVKSKLFLNVYPNPAKDIMTITSDRALMDAAFKVVSQTGERVLSGKLESESTMVDISNLSAGVYLLQVARKEWHSARFVKK